MEASFKQTSTNKEERYTNFIPDFKLLIEGVEDEVSVLANSSAALKEAFDLFWVGFYMVKSEQLNLGPFQGSVACYKIKKGRGVCGTAWAEAQTMVVPNVDEFPGHIACSSLSKSEIVVPIVHNGTVMGVLDIDSDQLNSFDDIDKKYLEQIVDIITDTLYNKYTRH